MFESLRPDPTFHPSPKLAMEAAPERYGYTALLSPDASRPDALAVVDLDAGSRTYGQVLHRLDMPYRGDEFQRYAREYGYDGGIFSYAYAGWNLWALGQPVQAPRHLVVAPVGVVGVDLDRRAVVVGQHLFDEIADRVAPEIPRHP